MRLVLQCAMCGTVNAVGAPACSTCRAAGVPQLRLMFECPRCHGLGLTPACAACPPGDEDLVFAEEIAEEPLSLDADVEFEGDEDAEDFELDLGDEEDEDESEEDGTDFTDDQDFDEDDSGLEELDSDLESLEEDEFDEDELEDEDFDSDLEDGDEYGEDDFDEDDLDEDEDG